jgi:hypothetical protein
MQPAPDADSMLLVVLLLLLLLWWREPGRGGIGRATAIEAQYDLPSNDDTATAIATVPSLAVATGDDNSERHVTLDEENFQTVGNCKTVEHQPRLFQKGGTVKEPTAN